MSSTNSLATVWTLPWIWSTSWFVIMPLCSSDNKRVLAIKACLARIEKGIVPKLIQSSTNLKRDDKLFCKSKALPFFWIFSNKLIFFNAFCIDPSHSPLTRFLVCLRCACLNSSFSELFKTLPINFSIFSSISKL